MRDNERVNDFDLAAYQLARQARIAEYDMRVAEYERKLRRADWLMYALIVVAVCAVGVLMTGVELDWW